MAEQRKYSVAEIDRMRDAVRSMMPLYGLDWGGEGFLRIVEERLRTHMLNGCDPDELEAAGKEAEIAHAKERAALAERLARQHAVIHRRIIGD